METEKYLEILGVKASSSISEIRKSYRLKAKAWHPDVNKSPDAHENFIKLREAFEYLTDLKSGRLTKAPDVEDTWTAERAEEVRTRAAKYADMNYGDFKKSNYSRGGEALETVADHIHLLFASVLSIALTTVLSFAIGPFGFFIGAVLSTILIFFSYKGIAGGVDLNRFLKSLWFLVSHKISLSVVLFAFNIGILLNIGFQTLIPLLMLFGLYFIVIVLMLVFMIFIIRTRTGFKLRFYPICLAPFIFNMFLVTNFVFSSNPREETYRFEMSSQSTTIILEGGKYSEYEGIRMFMDINDIFRKNLIVYTFEEGFLGLRVMKSFKIYE